MNLERRIERLKTANQKWKQVNEDLQNTNNSLRKRIKDLEADKLRQESYHEALVNENKKLEDEITHLKAKLYDEHLRKMNRFYEARKSKEQRSED